jgi:hypothetical protein
MPAYLHTRIPAGDAITVQPKMSPDEFMRRMLASQMILAMPGMGADTYRHWEALATG